MWIFLRSVLSGFGFLKPLKSGSRRRTNPAREIMTIEVICIIALGVFFTIILLLTIKFSNEIDNFNIDKYHKAVETIKL